MHSHVQAVTLRRMDREFWIDAWTNQQIGFHGATVNPQLLRHGDQLPGAPARVFVPLAGKSLDLAWLREQGYDVVGVELSSLAVHAFFEEQGLSPEVESQGELVAYRVPGLTLYCGNFFSISSTELAGVSALYDRAALVALPPALRQRYVAHLGSILARHTVGLLVALERTLNVAAGPPFSVSEQDVRALYEPAFSVLCLASYEPDDRGLRESVYRLERLG